MSVRRVLGAVIGILLASTALRATLLRDDSLSVRVLPFERFIEMVPYQEGEEGGSLSARSVEELRRLAVRFQREAIAPEDGPQFITIEVISRTRAGDEVDRFVQHAFTIAPGESPEADRDMIERVQREYRIPGTVNSDRINMVALQVDSLSPWGEVTIQVTPDEAFTRYADVGRMKQSWKYRVSGPRIESNFYIGIPKVVYDSNARDTVEYGSTSAIVRLSLLSPDTGEPFPVNFGIGVFGVNSPIDVSNKGGGFVLSLFLDAVQLMRTQGMSLSRKVNAGFEVAPFFSIRHQPRVLVNVRFGYTP